MIRIPPGGPRNAPGGVRQPVASRRFEGLALAIWSETLQDQTLRPRLALHVIDDGCVSVGVGAARPVPALKGPMDGLIAFVGVEVPVPLPTGSAIINLDFHARTGRQRPPPMQAPLIQVSAEESEGTGMDPYPPTKPPGQGTFALVEVELKPLPVPTQRTGPDREFGGRAAQGLSTPLGHGPAVPAGAIQRHVDADVVLWVNGHTPSLEGARVIGRKDAADERDQREGGAPVVAQSVDIPPRVPVLGDRDVEANWSSTLDAASRPEIAAIGTPAPG